MSKHPTKVGIILLSVLLPLLLLIVLVCAALLLLLLLCRRHRRRESDPEQESPSAQLEREVISNGPRRYTYRELVAATNNFAEDAKLGQGGFGSVYRGHLAVVVVGEEEEDRPAATLTVPVAIKMLSADSSAQGRKEFEAEVRIICQLTHRNLVRLLGWCDSHEGLLLVYELAAEGTLDKHLHNSDRVLTWPERYEIILGLGSSLRYLHGECKRCILHGDIKPSNIMLDSSYRTKLGDFGLARLVDHGTEGHTTDVLTGTRGYIDPAFLNTSRRSTESDVYSFGIVLLEIVSGRRPVGGFALRPWVWSLHGGNAILDAVDERLMSGAGAEGQTWWMERVLVVGLLCTQQEQSKRPSIAQAMHLLQSKDARLPELLTPQSYGSPQDFAVALHDLQQIPALDCFMPAAQQNLRLRNNVKKSIWAILFGCYSPP